MIIGYIKGQELQLKSELIVADTIDYLTAKFVFKTADWKGLSKWAHFKKGSTVYDIQLTSDGIEKSKHLNLAEGEWEVYLHGNEFEGGEVVERITTEIAKLTVKGTGLLNGEPFPEIPASESEQIEAKLADHEQRIEYLEEHGGGGGESYDDTELRNRIGAIEGKEASWNAKYNKPSGGIPKTDLASGVKESLEKADSALQEHQSLAAYRTASAQDVIDNTKVDKVAGKGLSTNDYTNADKAKVDSAVQPEDLSDYAEKSDLEAKQDKLIAGVNISISADGKTISATGGGNVDDVRVNGVSVLGANKIANINFTSEEIIDDTLTIPNVAADAKAVGDVFAFLGGGYYTAYKNFLEEISAATIGIGFFKADGTVNGNSGHRYTETYFSTDIFRYISSVDFDTHWIKCIVWYDENKAVVSTVGEESAAENYIVKKVDVPETAKYFRYSYVTSHIPQFFFKNLDQIFGVVEDTDLPINDISTVMTHQGGIKPNGDLSTYNAWKVSDYIKVIPGSRLFFSGYANWLGNQTLVPICFYDQNKLKVSAVMPNIHNNSIKSYKYGAGWKVDRTITYTSVNFGYVTVPQGAVYARISGAASSVGCNLKYYSDNKWFGKKCVFFGDSITAGIGSGVKYSELLQFVKGIVTANYAVNGSILVDHGMGRVQAFEADYADDDADAFIFAYGTNDWGGNKPLGEWYTTNEQGTRTLTTDTTTFRGALANIITHLKTNHDGKRIILMTPIHRGTGSFSSDFQKNGQGLYLEDYVKVIKEAGEIFSVNVIDMYGECDLSPDINGNTQYFSGNDKLHPNANGHIQMAKTIAAKLDSIPI